SVNCFSYWFSPNVQIENNKLYRVYWEVESSVINPDDAVQFRLRINQRESWSAWNRIVNSFLQNAPAAGNPKDYDVIFNPVVAGIGLDNQIVLSFDIMSFAPDDDVYSLLLLNSVRVAEIKLKP
ncbi:MAG: hypothetical protein N2246_05655, partial [Candidatus Sumerlaeia bacterium]|nr:hypothetical protein [Candidatus Sumerlaeia bacterium]